MKHRAARGGTMATKDEGSKDLHVLDHESAVLKDRLGITVRNIRDHFRCIEVNDFTQLQDTIQHP